jgi:hypothetical protein
MLPTEDHPKGWTVEQTKSAVAKIKDAPKKLEEWLSAETPTNPRTRMGWRETIRSEVGNADGKPFIFNVCDTDSRL